MANDGSINSNKNANTPPVDELLAGGGGDGGDDGFDDFSDSEPSGEEQELGHDVQATLEETAEQEKRKMVEKTYKRILGKMRRAYRKRGLGGGHPSASSQCPPAPKPGRDGGDVLTVLECILAVVIRLMPVHLKEVSLTLDRNLSSGILSKDIRVIRAELVASNNAAESYVGTHPRMEEFLTHGGIHWRIDEWWRMFQDMSEAPIPQAVQIAIQDELDDTVENGRDAKQEEWHGLHKDAKRVAKGKLSSEEYMDEQAERAAYEFEEAKAQEYEEARCRFKKLVKEAVEDAIGSPKDSEGKDPSKLPRSGSFDSSAYPSPDSSPDSSPRSNDLSHARLSLFS